MACVKGRTARAVIQWIAFGLLAAAVGLSGFAAFGCEFITLEHDFFDDENGGFFSGKVDGSCKKYEDPDEAFKDAFKIAKIFSAVTFATLGAMLVTMLCILLFWPRRNGGGVAWIIMRILCSLVMLFQGATFIVFLECADDESSIGLLVDEFDFECRPGPSAIAAAVNCVNIFLVSILLFIVPAPRYPLFCQPPISEDETPVTQQSRNKTTNPDVERASATVYATTGMRAIPEEGRAKKGEVESVTTTINPDGSRVTVKTFKYSEPEAHHSKEEEEDEEDEELCARPKPHNHTHEQGEHVRAPSLG